MPSGSNISLATLISQSTVSPANGRRSERLAMMMSSFPVVPGRGGNGRGWGWAAVATGSIRGTADEDIRVQRRLWGDDEDRG